LPVKDILPRVRPVLPPSIAPVEMTLEHESLHQPAFQQSYLAPSYAKQYKQALALSVLEEILSGGPTTRLYQSLVVEQKIAISAGFSFSGDALDYGSAWIYGTPAPGVELATLETALEAEITKIITEGVTEVEVSEAIKRMQNSAIFARDSVSGPAMIIGRALTTGQSLEQVEQWPEAIASVSAADIQAAAKTYLDKNAPWHRAPVTGYLLPKTQAIEQGVK